MDVQNRVSQALGRLPNEVKNTGVIVTKQASGFVFGAGVYSEHGEYDSLFLSNYIDVYVRDALKRVPGVNDAFLFGERKYAMRVWLDPARMAERGLTASTVINALQEQNVQVAAGQIGQPPNEGRAGVSDQREGRGPTDECGGVRKHYFEDGDGRHARAAEGCGPRGTGRRKL